MAGDIHPFVVYSVVVAAWLVALLGLGFAGRSGHR
jgi:hypothetical protein